MTLKNRAIRLLATREHAREELYKKLLPFAIKEMKAAAKVKADWNAFEESFENASYEFSEEFSEEIKSAAETVNQLLDELTRLDLLSETRYAKMRSHVRAPRFGNAKLAYELKSAGLSADLIQSTLEETEDELTRAKAVFKSKFGQKMLEILENPEDKSVQAKQKAQQMRFLQTRGFSGETIRKVIKNANDDLHNEDW